MPSIYTHNFFCNEVYNKLNKDITKKFEAQKFQYEIFSQSFDFLYYYNFLSLKQGKFIRDFGHKCHKNKCPNYFFNIIKYIKSNNLYNNGDLLSYLYGSITHFMLDSTMHPYINFLSKQSKNRKGMHNKIEFNIDAYYYNKKNNIKIYNQDFTKNIIKKYSFSNELKDCMNDVYYKTFSVKNIGNIYEKSYNQSKLIFKLFMVDRIGIKKVCYKMIDLLHLPINYMLSYISFHIKNVDKTFLNIDKKKWFFNKKSFKLSWEELYNIALDNSINIINNCELYFSDKIDEKELFKLFPNINYSGYKLKN